LPRHSDSSAAHTARPPGNHHRASQILMTILSLSYHRAEGSRPKAAPTPKLSSCDDKHLAFTGVRLTHHAAMRCASG
ncbi:MAG: hypothetical protein ACYC7I_06760, partial [Gammaproteobacteria bacterium]